VADRPEAQGLRVVRILDAPRERVWAEWTQPASFADWFGGAETDVPVASVSMDVRRGGVLRATMFAGPDRREILWTGEYLEVVEPSRLSFTLSDRPDRDEAELVTVVLTDLGDGRTEMLLEQRGHMTPAQYRHAEQGWGAFLDRLAERLA
jgi:uncharacterized protein YndB with AHSA1/START domain